MIEPVDELVRAVAVGFHVRALAVCCTGVVRELQEKHRSLPTSTVALGRVTTGALLMAGALKGREQLSISVKGDGILGEVFAIADGQGNVRATIDQPFVNLPPGRYDLSSAIGAGVLRVSKNLGVKEPYQSVVPLVDGGVAGDLVHYYLTSEQKPTAMAIGERLEGERVLAVGGFLIQAFPGTDDRALELIEERIAGMRPVSELLGEGAGPEQLLAAVLDDYTVMERHPVRFRCTCSRERYQRILISLGTEELEDMIKLGEETVLTCHFCSSNYVYPPDELVQLLAEARSVGEAPRS